MNNLTNVPPKCPNLLANSSMWQRYSKTIGIGLVTGLVTVAAFSVFAFPPLGAGVGLTAVIAIPLGAKIMTLIGIVITVFSTTISVIAHRETKYSEIVEGERGLVLTYLDQVKNAVQRELTDNKDSMDKIDKKPIQTLIDEVSESFSSFYKAQLNEELDSLHERAGKLLEWTPYMEMREQMRIFQAQMERISQSVRVVKDNFEALKQTIQAVPQMFRLLFEVNAMPKNLKTVKIDEALLENLRNAESIIIDNSLEKSLNRSCYLLDQGLKVLKTAKEFKGEIALWKDVVEKNLVIEAKNNEKKDKIEDDKVIKKLLNNQAESKEKKAEIENKKNEARRRQEAFRDKHNPIIGGSRPFSLTVPPDERPPLATLPFATARGRTQYYKNWAVYNDPSDHGRRERVSWGIGRPGESGR